MSLRFCCNFQVNLEDIILSMTGFSLKNISCVTCTDEILNFVQIHFTDNLIAT